MNDRARVPAGSFPLETASPASLGFHQPTLDRLRDLIRGHVAEGRYPGAQVALARNGKLAWYETFGHATLGPDTAATDDTLWLLFSNTKVVTAIAVWTLVDAGVLRFGDRVAEYLPDFARHGKGEVTLAQVLSHVGGFPSQDVSRDAWTDHALMRQNVCDFTLEWTPGTRLEYHRRTAHWTAAAVMEAVTGKDYRDVIRERVLMPLGLDRDVYVGLPDAEHGRAATMFEPAPNGSQRALGDENTAPYRRAGVPSSGGYATARGMVGLYQMLANHGRLNGARLLSRRLIEFATRNHTGDMQDDYMGMPMHRGLGVHVRGTTLQIRGLGSLASPRTYGHGGVGASYCWTDPDSGVSFAYLTNSRIPEPWHSRRLDFVSNLVHSAIE